MAFLYFAFQPCRAATNAKNVFALVTLCMLRSLWLGGSSFFTASNWTAFEPLYLRLFMIPTCTIITMVFYLFIFTSFSTLSYNVVD